MTDKITITRKDGAYIVTIDGVLFWLGEECERAIRRERKERGR